VIDFDSFKDTSSQPLRLRWLVTLIGNLSTPSPSVDLPWIHPFDTPPNGSFDCRRFWDRNGMLRRQPRVESFKIVEDTTGRCRNRPAGCRQVDVPNCFLN
jgi:hypothetical protein